MVESPKKEHWLAMKVARSSGRHRVRRLEEAGRFFQFEEGVPLGTSPDLEESENFPRGHAEFRMRKGKALTGQGLGQRNRVG